MTIPSEASGKIDRTFNHQLWFASASAGIRDSDVDALIKRFIKYNALTVETYNDGVIYHGSNMPGISTCFSRIQDFDNLKLAIKRRLRKPKLRSKSVGYHSFNCTPT